MRYRRLAAHPGRPRATQTYSSPIDLVQLRLVEYNPDQDSIISICSWSHPEEVWDVTCHASCSDRLVTVHSKGELSGMEVHKCSSSRGYNALSHAGPVHTSVIHAACSMGLL
jgi:hypothetical protein